MIVWRFQIHVIIVNLYNTINLVSSYATRSKKVYFCSALLRMTYAQQCKGQHRMIFCTDSTIPVYTLHMGIDFPWNGTGEN